jgi:hypothetical protein
MGETLYKMAAAHALSDVDSMAKDLLGMDQFALVSGGSEAACLALKAALETKTGVSTDIENAFNSLDRSVILNRLFAKPELAPIWRLTHWIYAQPVNLHLYNSEGTFLRYLVSDCGALQGEPFSSFLFCLATKSVIDEAKLAGGPEVGVVAITDDVTFVGPADGAAVTRAVRAYEAGCAQLNLRFQGAKSHYITFNGAELCAEAKTFAEEKGMKIESECCIIGGTPMGPCRQKVQAAAFKIAQKSVRFFAALQHENMTTAVADRLLRLCGVPRMQYLARVGFPGEYEQALTFFDERVKEAARRQAGLQDQLESAAVSTQQATPLRHAGFAFRKYNDSLCFFAFVGACAGAAPHIQRLCPEGLPPTFAAALQRALPIVRERIDGATAETFLPPVSNANQSLLFYQTEPGKSAAIKLQRTLTRAADDFQANITLRRSSPMDRARYFACTAPYASSWLSDPFLAQPMNSEAHGAACKLRLNQPITHLTECFCGADMTNDPWHVLSHKGGAEAIRRHDEIVDKLADAIQRAGGQAWIEPRQDFLDDRRRTDIFAMLGAKAYHIDVCVTHPTSRSYITQACQGSLASTSRAVQRKRRRFGALAAAEGATLVPFIVETFGGFGNEARALISDIAIYAANNSPAWPEYETRLTIRSEIHKALFEGNLRVANEVFQRSNPIRYASGRHGAIPPRPRMTFLDYDTDEEEGEEVLSTASIENPIRTTTTMSLGESAAGMALHAQLLVNTRDREQTSRNDVNGVSMGVENIIGEVVGREVLPLIPSTNLPTADALSVEPSQNQDSLAPNAGTFVPILCRDANLPGSATQTYAHTLPTTTTTSATLTSSTTQQPLPDYETDPVPALIMTPNARTSPTTMTTSTTTLPAPTVVHAGTTNPILSRMDNSSQPQRLNQPTDNARVAALEFLNSLRDMEQLMEENAENSSVIMNGTMENGRNDVNGVMNNGQVMENARDMSANGSNDVIVSGDMNGMMIGNGRNDVIISSDMNGSGNGSNDVVISGMNGNGSNMSHVGRESMSNGSGESDDVG